ncbi:MAG TPA: alpha/beta hydrolase family protein [Pyrinomonadaceae bacterium]|jgi:S-formylglutathione hydrolase FrmB|nr:alpha/beta hydrolase family protein [Pyrinomonadaceae bacterium]
MKKRTRTLLLLLALLLAASAHAQTAQAKPTPAPSAAAQKQPGGKSDKQAEGPRRYETVQFESRLVGASLPYNVILPADYNRASSRQKRYPVVYLLHGLGGSAADWVSNRAHLADYAAQYPFIIIVPEGKDGWYTDGVAPAEKFESYFVEELIPDVDRRFRTIAAREGRAVAGLSMGGYGSLKFGLKYPDRFALAASMSGALGAPSWTPEMALPAFVKPSIARVYGPAVSEVRRANDIFRITRELTPAEVSRLPYFYLDCGTEDFLISNSRDFSALLIEKKVAHEFRELPGTHSWPYWDRQVQEILRLAAQKLAPARDERAAGH